MTTENIHYYGDAWDYDLKVDSFLVLHRYDLMGLTQLIVTGAPPGKKVLAGDRFNIEGVSFIDQKAGFMVGKDNESINENPHFSNFDGCSLVIDFLNPYFTLEDPMRISIFRSITSFPKIGAKLTCLVDKDENGKRGHRTYIDIKK